MATVKQLSTQRNTQKTNMAKPLVASLVGVSEQGIPLVECKALAGGAVEAASTLGEQECAAIVSFPVPVLLMIPDAASSKTGACKPLITGIVRDTLFPINQTLTATPEGDRHLPSTPQTSVTGSLSDKTLRTQIDGKTVTLNAEEEILLRCGKSSILLRKDGKVVIKGVNVLSRSSSTNKIKGSSVSIN